MSETRERALIYYVLDWLLLLAVCAMTATALGGMIWFLLYAPICVSQNHC